jgi:catechol 2,3-dioxygenase-like lactoylglutathione lyase family enzyme
MNDFVWSLTRNTARGWRVALSLLLLWGTAAAQSVIAVDAPGFTVSDADRSGEFFQRVLSFEKVSDSEVTGSEYEHLQGVFGVRMRIVRMRLGDEFVELTEYLAPQGRPIPADARSNDHAFQHIAIIVSNMDKAYQWLRKHKVTHASTGPQRLPDWNKNAGGIKAFYFKDPDGHALEILEFPADKGNPKWHKLAAANPNKLFLGIDHTAIVVSDTDASLKFYRDVLGLKVVGASENYGIEQERLNNVFGARLRITALRAESGPGIEFLEYLAPRDGRPRPMDIGSNDLLHWQTKLVTRAATAVERGVMMNKYPLISSGVIGLPNGEMSFKKSFLVRDPDGHAMQLIER